MKKRVYIIAVFSTTFSISHIFAMATPQSEIQRKLELVQIFTPIAKLAPQVKLRLLLALLPQVQEKDIDQLVTMHKTNGTAPNADLLKQLLTNLKQQAAQTNQTGAPAATQSLQQKVKTFFTNVKAAVQTRVNQALATATQQLRPEERVGLVLYLAHAVPQTSLQAADLPDTVKSTLGQLKAQASALKETIQNKYAPHLKAEIAKHEQEIISQTEADTP